MAGHSKDPFSAGERFRRSINEHIQSFAGKTWDEFVTDSIVEKFGVARSQAAFFVEEWKEKNDAT